MLRLVDVDKERGVVLQHVTESVGAVAGGDGVESVMRQAVAVHRVLAVESQQSLGQALARRVDESLTLEVEN